jgi:hypothetical protein
MFTVNSSLKYEKGQKALPSSRVPLSPMPDRERTSRVRILRTSRLRGWDTPLCPAVENFSSVGMQGDLIFQQGVQESAALAVMQACRMVSRLFQLNRMLSFCRDDEWKATAVIVYPGYSP